jgi:hypothetical protein
MSAANPAPQPPMNFLLQQAGFDPETIDLMYVSEALSKVHDVLSMLDWLPFNENINGNTAAGISWTLQSCMDALKYCESATRRIARHG